MRKERKGIYVHIPFCARKCEYCDFLSMAADAQTQRSYMKALTEQLRLYARETRGTLFDSLYIGGGTPSLLALPLIEPILQVLAQDYQWRSGAEKSIEVNPGSIDRQKAQAYRHYGLNRISMGAQSMQERELRLLGRIHDAAAVRDSLRIVREAGFDNVNIDLMYALPGQSPATFMQTLEEIIALEPEHISAYSLIIEEETPFFVLYEEDERRRSQGRRPKALPTEEEEREMAAQTKRRLAAAGFEQYEVSNYARPGFRCRHNYDCWRLQEYLGIGLGASGFWQGYRFRQPSDMATYLETAAQIGLSGVRDRQACTKQSLQEEFMFLGLRLNEGVSLRDFAERFGEEAKEVYGRQLHKLTADGLIEISGDRLRLTESGCDISSFVLAHFLQD
ncbi:MAG: radical SAM family heme chaperone HemW [Eubacteriales bacterium]|nr:radical SAM family heme chaperone HemW [Eubacteriales bacterium]